MDSVWHCKHEQLSKAIVFKGGTVLKKVYFEDYRFSEDLDFTLLNNEISNEQIFSWFREVFEFIKEEANIPLEILTIMNMKMAASTFISAILVRLADKVITNG
jgi:predicted nucleotidyltransferase component of viral defense system